MPELETNIENRICKYVQGIGGLALKLVIDGQIGFPDRTLLLPGGIVIFIEVKRPDKCKVYNAQLVWKGRLERRGFRCEFVNSLEEVARLCKSAKL